MAGRRMRCSGGEGITDRERTGEERPLPNKQIARYEGKKKEETHAFLCVHDGKKKGEIDNRRSFRVASRRSRAWRG
jgi:hypothetical protein